MDGAVSGPKVSVCIPTYNRAHYIEQAVASVLTQTFQDFEIIVFDDASTDGTHEIVEQMADARIRYHRHPRNLGIAATRNCCLEVARGEYIGWLDSDDVYLPNMLATQCAVLDQHSHAGMVHGVAEVIDGGGKRLPDWRVPSDRDVVLPGGLAFRELLLGLMVVVPTVLVRRMCYERVGGYTSTLRNCSEDWDMWLRIALHYDMAYTAMPVARYRWHVGNTHQRNLLQGRVVPAHAEIISRVFGQYRDRISDHDALLAGARAVLAARALVSVREAYGRGDRWGSLTQAITAFRIVPSLGFGAAGHRLIASILRGDEVAIFNHSNELLLRLLPRFAGSDFGSWVKKIAIPDPEWQRTVREVAHTIHAIVPEDGRVAMVDKEDPTLLQLSARSGWHFPDRHVLPGGYPSDSRVAIEHLRQLRRKGAQYIVFPNVAFWWLEYYGAFRDHLDRCHQRIWGDDSCVVYQLSPIQRRAEPM